MNHESTAENKTEKKVEKKSQKPIERVTISEALKPKLSTLTMLANDALQGIASVNKSDVVNLILEEHAESLSPKEVERLKAVYIDQMKLALWLANEVRDAKKAGESVTLKELLERCEAVLQAKPSRARERTKKDKAESPVSDRPDVPTDPPDETESP